MGFLFLWNKLFQVQLHVIVFRGNLVCRVTEPRSAESKVRRDNAAVFMVSDRRKGIHLKKRITNLVI
ncbi:hypothetical protein D4R42_03180 [bacterium]|nr:MAG: hypothetical protein D4R42_03180 [bacterium]